MSAAEEIQTAPEASASLKVEIKRADLLKSLNYTQSVVERRGTIPILSNIRLEAAEGGLKLTSTDMDISVEDKAEASLSTEGATTVPAHTFFDIIRKLPEGKSITIDKAADDAKLTIKCGSSRFSLSTLPVTDFPVMDEGDLTHHFSLPAAELHNLIEKTRFAVSTEETRYYLNGVYMHTTEEDGNKVLRTVATDGHRLARLETSVPDGASGMPGIIIPRKTIGELRKLTEETDGAIEISLSETKIRFRAGDTVLISKLIDGTFPDYSRVIPSGNDKIMEVNCKELSSAVDRVSVIATEKSRGIKLHISQGNVKLAANSPEQGTASEDLDVTYSADEIETGFNSRYLLDMLAQIEGDSVQFVLAESTAPALVRDPGDVGAVYVIMPMRV